MSKNPLDSFSAEEAAFIEEKVEEYAAKLQKAKAEIAKENWGQEKIIEHKLTSMLADGHMISIGAPGLGKTRLVSRVGHVMGLSSKRQQFTAETLPGDILGSEVLETDDKGNKSFRFIEGPVFTQLFMADEINRASPRTQSALLQAMEERMVTIAAHPHLLPRPFLVMATQNPLEQEGTYPLPEAQLDRFLLNLKFDYPDRATEEKIIKETTGTREDLSALFARSANGDDLTDPNNYDDIDNKSRLEVVMDKNDLVLMQKLAARLPLSDDALKASAEIVRRARPFMPEASAETNELVSWGPGPRAGQAFARAAKARALMQGKLAPDVGDILALVDPVLEHRMSLNKRARSKNEDFQTMKQRFILNI